MIVVKCFYTFVEGFCKDNKWQHHFPLLSTHNGVFLQYIPSNYACFYLTKLSQSGTKQHMLCQLQRSDVTTDYQSQTRTRPDQTQTVSPFFKWAGNLPRQGQNQNQEKCKQILRGSRSVVLQKVTSSQKGQTINLGSVVLSWSSRGREEGGKSFEKVWIALQIFPNKSQIVKRFSHISCFVFDRRVSQKNF